MTALQERTTISGAEINCDFATINWIAEPAFLPKERVAIHTPAPSTRLEEKPLFPAMTSKVIDVIVRLLEFRGLQENWDGNDALPPSKKLIDSALRLIMSTNFRNLPLYFTAPGPNGEIVIEYKKGDRMAEIYLEENASPELILYTVDKQSYVGAYQPLLLSSHFEIN